MKKFEERENKRKSIVEDIVNINKKKENKKDVTPRTFYIRNEQIKALAFEKAKTGKNLSEIVRESLDNYFKEKTSKYK